LLKWLTLPIIASSIALEGVPVSYSGRMSNCNYSEIIRIAKRHIFGEKKRLLGKSTAKLSKPKGCLAKLEFSHKIKARMRI
jgi:hypothetical protein